ncbi:MAG: hypothetical protein HYV07_07695 [Deltaproteobacteria bacterium]|nr:hypothetical protein [Deltaproteobacteria bacterium]
MKYIQQIIMGLGVVGVAVIAMGSVSCGDTFESCSGSQDDYDRAFAACKAAGESDKAAGKEQGASYNNGPYDVCNDNLGDEGTRGCEAGYAEGFGIK